MTDKPQGGFRDMVGSWHVVVAGVVLLVATLTMQAAIRKLGLVFAKADVPLASPLVEFPEKIGYRFELARGFNGKNVDKGKEVLPADVVKTLGTEEFISWYYVDKLKSTSKSVAYVRLHMAYYTGLLDAAPHVPENCRVAGGQLPDESTTKNIQWSLPAPPAGWESWKQVDVRQAGFVGDKSDGSKTRSVAFYFFAANGEPASRHRVIAMMSDPRKKYCYFMKIELGAGRFDREIAAEESEQMCRDFFTAAADDIFKHVASVQDIQTLEAGR